MHTLSQKALSPSKQLHFTEAKRAVQPKLKINEPGDQYEQEADAMAGKVMRMVTGDMYSPPGPMSGLIGRSVQRKCSRCEEEEKRRTVMRKASTAQADAPVSSSFVSSLHSATLSGASLPKATRTLMEHAFKRDFSGVRVHSDRAASQLSKRINAKAFTYGNDIYFGEGEYNTNSTAGQRLLAHELTHVVQQGGGQMQVQRQAAHTYTFLSRGSYGETTSGYVRPSCVPGATAGTTALAAGSANPVVTVFPNGTYRVRRDDGVEQTATCPRSAAGAALTLAHENSHAAGARAGVATANANQGLPRTFPTAGECATALAAWNATVDAAWNNEVTHGPGTNPPTAQTFTQEHAAGTCTFS